MFNTIPAKKFLIIFFSLFFVFILYNLIIWNLYTKQIFNREDGKYIGDLGRLSYQVDSLNPRKLEYTMKNRFITTIDNQKINIITVGDSFSNADMGGKNPYYQDYLTTLYDKNILNLRRQEGHHPFKTIIHLYNNGWLKKHTPDIIIIEFAERFAVSQFGIKFNFKEMPKVKTPQIQEKVTHNSYIPRLTFVNSGNYKIPFYTMMYHFNTHAVKSVYKFKLSKNVFSTNNYKDQLLVIDTDLNNIPNNTLKSVSMLNNNFNKLAKLLKQLDIKLFFMPAVDKYDLYYNYIKDENLPKNNFFDLIRPLHKEYYFVDTKKILMKKVQQGVSDIFYSDDTHWSYKASETIAKDEIFEKNL